MPYEVVNTSAPRGLLQGQSGYCDVLRTEGTPQGICAALAPMSRYDERLSGGEAAFAVRTLRHGGQAWGVITRTAPSGLDYTGRGNRLAHHLVVEPSELLATDPAAVLARFEFMQRFEGEPRFLHDMPQLPAGAAAQGAWQAAGLKGWDAVIVQALANPSARVAVVLPPGLQMGPLLSELLSRLTPRQRWELGVCTGCDAPSAWNDRARLRVVVADMAEACPATWPAESLHDLRERPRAVPAAGNAEALAGATPRPGTDAEQRRWVVLGPDPRHAAELAPIEVSLGREGEAIAIADFETAETEEAPATSAEAPPAEPLWGIVGLWFGLGALSGALVAFILASALRNG